MPEPDLWSSSPETEENSETFPYLVWCIRRLHFTNFNFLIVRRGLVFCKGEEKSLKSICNKKKSFNPSKVVCWVFQKDSMNSVGNICSPIEGKVGVSEEGIWLPLWLMRGKDTCTLIPLRIFFKKKYCVYPLAFICSCFIQTTFQTKI